MRSYKFAAGDKEEMFSAIGSYVSPTTAREQQPSKEKLPVVNEQEQDIAVEKSPMRDQPQPSFNPREVPMTEDDWIEEFGDLPLEQPIDVPFDVKLEKPQIDPIESDMDTSLERPEIMANSSSEEPLMPPKSRSEEEPLDISYEVPLDKPTLENIEPEINTSLEKPEIAEESSTEEPLLPPESRPEEEPLDISYGVPMEKPTLENMDSEPNISLEQPKEEDIKQPSSDRYNLTFNNEIARGWSDSREPHFPGGSSGVTIGPGYDLKHRTEKEVVDDLTKVGVDRDKAVRLSKGVGLTGDSAESFADSNDDIELTDEQEKELFSLVVPKYEKRARKDYSKLNIPNKPDFEDLPDEVKTLLVDYSYNVGVSKFPKFFKALVEGDKNEALKQYKRYSGGKPLGRRNKDTLKFIENYSFKKLN